MSDTDEILDALTSSGKVISNEFGYALRTWTRSWQMTVHTVSAENGRIRSFSWIYRNLVGHLTERGDDASPKITGVVASISNIGAVQLETRFAKPADSAVGYRILTADLGAGEPLFVDTSADHPAGGADPDRFIDYLLDSIQGTATT